MILPEIGHTIHAWYGREKQVKIRAHNPASAESIPDNDLNTKGTKYP
jgi:hypothetical protein